MKTAWIFPASLLSLLGSQALAESGTGFSFSFSEPDSASIVAPAGSPISFTVGALVDTLRPSAGDAPRAEAWSMSIRVEGATLLEIEEITARGGGGEAADYFRSQVTAGGGVLAAVLELDHDRERTLPPEGGPYPVARLRLEGTVPPADGPPCRVCRLRYEDGLEGGGEPVANVVTSSGKSYTPLVSERIVALEREASAPPRVEWSGEPRELELTLSDCRPSESFSSHAPPGAVLLLELEDITEPPASNANALYLRWGERAGPRAFDLAADDRGNADQRLVVITRDDLLWVEVRSARRGPEAVRLRVRGTLVAAALESIEPRRAARGQAVHATLLGGGFIAAGEQPSVPLETRFFLEHAVEGTRLEASERTVVCAGRAEVVFDLSGEALPLGSYDAVIENRLPDGTLVSGGRLPGALQLVERTLPGTLQVTLTGPDRYRRGRVSLLRLQYRNVGETEIPAPLLRVTGPPDTTFRLPRERESRSGGILLLGIDPIGAAGRLAPGTGGDIPIVIESPECDSGDCPATFEVLRLRRERSVPIDWETLSPPAGIENWDTVWPLLRAELGSTWGDYARNLGRLATRWTRRGHGGASARGVFRFATKIASACPAAAVLGRAVRVGSHAPVADGLVVALRRGEVVRAALTDDAGTFALEGLQAGGTYDLEVAGYTGNREVEIPEAGDVLDVELGVLEGENPREAPADEPGACAPLPESLLPPEEALSVVARWDARIVGSIDPNSKNLSDGDRGGAIIGAGRDLRYTIHFENLASAGAPAEKVVITDDLDPGFDWSTFRFREIVVGDDILYPAAMAKDRFSGFQRFGSSERYESRSRREAYDVTWEAESWTTAVEARMKLDLRTGRATWEITAGGRDDPSGGDPVPDDALGGFLPPNREPPRGEGYVSFSIQVRADTPDGTLFRNGALTRFDGGPALRTNEVVSRFSRYRRPGRPRYSQPASGDPIFLDLSTPLALSWEPSPGAVNYDVYFWEEGQDRPPQPTGSGLPVAAYEPPAPLIHGNTYLWQVVARSPAGMEVEGPVWTLELRAPSRFRRGDADGDDRLNITDGIAILGYLFLGGEAPACQDAADADDSGGLTITDAVRIFGYLFLGGEAPAAPGPSECGLDPSDDGLSCRESTGCAAGRPR